MIIGYLDPWGDIIDIILSYASHITRATNTSDNNHEHKPMHNRGHNHDSGHSTSNDEQQILALHYKLVSSHLSPAEAERSSRAINGESILLRDCHRTPKAQL